MRNIKFLIGAYFLVIFGLFLYSFTQVDLGLTLTKLSVWQSAQHFLQSIGYFDRPLSTNLYIAVIVLLFSFYFLFLYFASNNKISKKQVWILIIGITLILFSSYNAFSYDLFNYIFDAKIVTAYNLNPYEHKALDFPNDPMLSFMHWTHRTYPYGPVWLALTVPLSFLGLQFFLVTFFLFKAFVALSFLGTVFCIGKIIKKILPERELFGIVFFGLNPLIIIEGLVSAHNDIVMLFLAVVSIYLFLSKKYFRTILILLLSIGVKFASVFILPVFLVAYFFRNNKKFTLNNFFILTLLAMIIPILLASLRTTFQPWYILYFLTFAAFISHKYYVLIPSVILSFFGLLQYIPFLYLGNWDSPVPTILFWLTVAPIALSAIIVIIWISRSFIFKDNKA